MPAHEASTAAPGRLDRLATVALVLFGILWARLWYLQLMQGGHFAALAERNRLRVVPVTAPRGLLYDRNGQVLVRNRTSYTASIIPEEMADSTGDQGEPPLASTLAELLRVPRQTIEEAWRAQARRYSFEPVRIARDLSVEQLIALEEHRAVLPGVMVEQEPVRDYLRHSTAAHVVGQVAPITLEELTQLADAGYRGTDLIGRTGLERVYESYLRGQDGYRQIEVDARGRFRRLVEEKPPVPGMDLHLTLDLELQKATETALVEGIQAAEARRLRDPRLRSGRPVEAGAAVALDPRTGGILALASFPAFDPAALLPWAPDRELYLEFLNRDPNHPFFNRVTMGTYAPGSIFKVVTATAALEDQRFGPDERFYVDGHGPYGKTDWMLRAVPRIAPPGWVDLVGGFEWSSNDFFWELGRRVGIERLAYWARRFGLGTATGVDLYPPDQPGLVPDAEWKREYFRSGPAWQRSWYEAETLDMAIGQGFLQVTPLQMAVVYMAVANGGTAYRPHLVASVTRPDGTPVVQVQPSVLLRVPASPQTWALIRKGLWSVVNGPHGTARGRFADIPVQVMGKTGTAQLSAAGSETNAWFAAVAPADAPEIVVVVLVENGGGGAGVAAPIAHDILKAYFDRRATAAGPSGAAHPGT
ncbi:penicillin-binding protein 2 [Carboxydochorda subterranea]|uniref:Penicillin-binding protein 2 n=1 Tax=Carboxydichorda subterranea TaxID=3109565 RepID=A0ABZ1BZG8_9FIRM|nr:penicillin-binding protein 2 [Limnochorda sp. L945t]WRP18219.1 penicillin-binding protein 2 [Limnochorda sp. L945t]